MKALAILVIAGCSTSPSNVVATLEVAVATVERMPGEQQAWKPARKGDTFVIGSAVRTGIDSTAKLRVGRSGKLDVKPKSVVYFTRDGKRRRDEVKVETGSIEIEAGDELVGLGEATLEPHSRARIETGTTGTTIVVTLGRLELEDNIIEAGKSITLSAGVPVAAEAPKPPPPSDKITVAIDGRPARLRTADGETVLEVGEHSVDANATILASRDGSTSITADGRDGGYAEFPGGVMKVPGGAAGSAHVDKTGTHITAQRGSIAVETTKGSESVAQGESVTVTPAGAIERLPPPPKETVATIEAGESPVVHDAKAPTAVRVQFAKVCTTATVEVAKDRAFKRLVARSGGREAANVLVPAGAFSYRVRCGSGKRASGTIRVARDAGSRPLPKTAAKTTIDLDGRDYTIYYQNLLPELTLSLRNAPRSLEYTFVVKSGAGEKRFESMTPKTTLAPGELREGKYTAWAELDGGRRSEQGRITIEFDNAAASASIDGVDDGRVRGTVIEGTTVTIAGAPVELDRHRRFSTTLPAATAVRIAHPKAGIHYYVVHDD